MEMVECEHIKEVTEYDIGIKKFTFLPNLSCQIKYFDDENYEISKTHCVVEGYPNSVMHAVNNALIHKGYPCNFKDIEIPEKCPHYTEMIINNKEL